MDHEIKYYASQVKSGDFYEKVIHFFLKTFKDDKKMACVLGSIQVYKVQNCRTKISIFK